MILSSFHSLRLCSWSHSYRHINNESILLSLFSMGTLIFRIVNELPKGQLMGGGVKPASNPKWLIEVLLLQLYHDCFHFISEIFYDCPFPCVSTQKQSLTACVTNASSLHNCHNQVHRDQTHH